MDILAMEWAAAQLGMTRANLDYHVGRGRLTPVEIETHGGKARRVGVTRESFERFAATRGAALSPPTC